MVAHHEEGTLLVAILEPFQRKIGDDVGGIAFVGLSPFRLNHDRIVVESLSGQHVPIVKSSWVGITAVSEVPFADHRGLIAIGLEHFRDARPSAIKMITQGLDTVEMAVLTGQNVRTTRCANGIDTETVMENHTAVCDTIKVRCLINPTPITADSV